MTEVSDIGDPTNRVHSGFFSFTEVTHGEHRSYNEWHLFDHLPEQYTLTGIEWGQRWVLSPDLAPHRIARQPLDRVHYVTLYLLGRGWTPQAFQDLATQLRAAGRFHEHRIAHRAGWLGLSSWAVSPGVEISAGAIPFRPSTGVHVRVGPVDADLGDPEALVAVPGVAGIWEFHGIGGASGTMHGLRVLWCWLDADPATTAEAIADTVPVPPAPDDADAWFVATLASIDPHGAWDWFDGTAQ